jgi:tRNA pseudouridine32 synthase/23S rRNA pseudouridine746 synthase
MPASSRFFTLWPGLRMMNCKSLEIMIVHRESSFVIINKPSGLLAVPGSGPEKQDCVVSRLKTMIPEMIDQPAVHRLDMYTSGLMVVAIDQQTHRNLCRQFEDRLVSKRYIALLDGIVEGESGKIELPFRLDPDNRPFQVYDPFQGKRGVTFWKKISGENGRTRIEFTPVTGRTHQLRVHAAHELGLGIPIVGDRLYGNGCEGEQMLLHACFLEFTHPGTGETLRFDSPVPF